MGEIRSALYLDFDNVFSGLLKLDPVVAFQFAEEPVKWLGRLRTEVPSSRRWLVLRCYMNPSGSVADPRTDSGRVTFFRFRSAFTDAGFEVVDCPRLSHTKNGADIRLVIDAVESLRADTRYDEYVIASGDSDMTPLLIRLRAADREVTLISPSDSALVMQAVADRLIGGDELVELIDTRDDDIEASLDIDIDGDPTATDAADLNEDDARSLFTQRVVELYTDAQDPLNLAALGSRLSGELGTVTTASGWFGSGGFVRALRALDLPHMRIDSHFMWDETRHSAPAGKHGDTSAPQSMETPAVVDRVTTVLKLPALSPVSWKRIYESLASYVQTHSFNLNEMTRWTRDQLAGEGLPVNRQAPSLVAKGSAYGGTPLFRDPPPSEDEIAQAFVTNLVDRAAAAELDLSPDDVSALRNWFGRPSPETATLD